MGKVQKISDDDEKGTAKATPTEAPEGAIDTKTLVETTGADKRYVMDQGLIRAVSMMPVLEDESTPKGGAGIPKGEEVIDGVVRGTGKDKYAVVATDAGRKYIKAL